MAACPKCGKDQGCECVEHGSLLDFLETFRSASPSKATAPAPVVGNDGPLGTQDRGLGWARPDEPDPVPAAEKPASRSFEPPPGWSAPVPTAEAWPPHGYQPPPPYQPAYQPVPSYPPPPPYQAPPSSVPAAHDPYAAGSYGTPPPPGFIGSLSKGWRRGITALASVAGLMVIASGVALVTNHQAATAQTIVAGALSRSFDQRTAAVEFTMTATTAGGQTFTASGPGTIDFAGRSLDLHMTISPMDMQIEGIFIDGTVYESVPEISTVEPGKSWISIDLTRSQPSNGSGGGVGFSNNPTESLQLLEQKGAQVTKLGPSTVGGGVTQGYSITYPPNVWNSMRLDPNTPAALRTAMANLSMSSQVYINSSDQLARVVVDITSPNGPTIYESLDFSNYGVATSIAPPDSSKVVPFQQFLNDARSLSE